MQYLVSILVCFAIIPQGKRELVAVYLQSLPHGVVGWSAVCDCGIFWTLRFKNCAQHRRLPDYYLTYRDQNSL